MPNWWKSRNGPPTLANDISMSLYSWVLQFFVYSVTYGHVVNLIFPIMIYIELLSQCTQMCTGPFFLGHLVLDWEVPVQGRQHSAILCERT